MSEDSNDPEPNSILSTPELQDTKPDYTNIDIRAINEIIDNFDDARYIRYMAMALIASADINTQKYEIAKLLRAIQTPDQEQLREIELGIQKMTSKQDWLQRAVVIIGTGLGLIASAIGLPLIPEFVRLFI